MSDGQFILAKQIIRVLISLPFVVIASCSSQSSSVPQDGRFCPFVYDSPRSNVEAEQIGFEMLGRQGPLLLADTVYERVLRDLTLIRGTRPELADQQHLGLWPPNHVMISIADGHTIVDLEEINTCYQAKPTHLFDRWYVLELPGKLNVPRLAALYAALAPVSIANVDGIVGQENYWTPEDRGGGTWRWTVDDGFYDCFDGCDCHTYYRFDINEIGTVVLLERWQEGMPYCVFP
jgi:hypothetical protein